MKRTNGFSAYGFGLVVLTVFTSFLLLASEAKAQDERLSLEKYLDMESVANPQISPDRLPDHLHASVGEQGQ